MLACTCTNNLDNIDAIKKLLEKESTTLETLTSQSIDDFNTLTLAARDFFDSYEVCKLLVDFVLEKEGLGEM